MDKEWIASLWSRYGGRIAGTFSGIVLGLIYLKVGFFKTLLFVLIVVLGFYVGKKLDRQGDLKQKIDSILDRFRAS